MLDKKRRRGFTYLEIMFVLFIIAVIFAIVVYSVSKAKAQSKWKTCASNLAMIGNALQMYANNNNGAYPADLSILAANGRYLQGGLPQCPVTNSPYYYTGTASGSRFTLFCQGTNHADVGVGADKPAYDYDNLKVVDQ